MIYVSLYLSSPEHVNHEWERLVDEVSIDVFMSTRTEVFQQAVDDGFTTHVERC